MIRATVLIPTHDHGRLLEPSARSVLAQTVEDLELFIVGDGVPDETRDVVATLRREDPRVRFFDHPKGPRHGEIHRHAALAHARGAVVAYQSDDDLWLPHHLEVLEAALREVDLAATLSLRVDARDGSLRPGITQDLSRLTGPGVDGSAGRSPLFLSLSRVAHTLELYRRLPHGWRTTPPGIATDVYMWRQILSQPGVRARAVPRPTCIGFPSPDRAGWSLEARHAELVTWWERVRDPAFRAGLEDRVLEALAFDHARRAVRLRRLRAERERGLAWLAWRRLRDARRLGTVRRWLRPLRRWAGAARGARGAP